MSVLDRPMFQNGGLVRGSQLPTSYGQSQQNTYTFEPTENPDTVMYVEIDQDGNRVSEVPVDLTLSATRNPSEAFNRQRSEQSLGRLQTAIGLGLSLIPSYRLARMGITAAANALKPILAKIPQLTIRQRDTLTGPGSVAKLTNPNQIIGLTDAGKNVALGIGGAGGIAGLEALKPGPVDIQQELTDLQTKPDRLSGSLFDPLKPEEPEKPEKPEIVYDKAKISNVLSDEKFDAFLKALTGSLSTGFFTPAAQAPDIAAKALEANKFKTIKTTEAKTNAEFNKEILTNINEFERTEKNLSRLQYATSLVDKGATGLSGLFGKLWTKALALINERQRIDFENLDSRTQADAILNALRQQDIQKLLGESGRTISNLDREIVAEIFGTITVDTTPAEIKEKLKQIAFRYRGEMKKNRNNILSGIDYFNQTNMPSSVLVANADIIKKILDISDFLNYKPPVYDPKAEGFFDASGGNVIDAGSLGD
tara:strand:+ start:440 stop:1882 length:1443 start_codon:yes stop_codon:yes gene_type:complete